MRYPWPLPYSWSFGFSSWLPCHPSSEPGSIGACKWPEARTSGWLGPVVASKRRIQALWWGALLAVMVGPATWIVLRHDLGKGGSWLLLAMLVVFQPFVSHPWQRSLFRALGTILGFVVAFAIS